ncbi:hypothetical protein KW805_03055 [Candidatus Pacearchaeota archaeon]|nr:hypothetical protein [Candidatus Pacearchaeota archaeon]
MKHSIYITLLLLGMFFVTQVIGIIVVASYAPHVEQVKDPSGNVMNVSVYNLPYGMNPPDTPPRSNLISIMISIAFAVIIMFVLMRVKAEMFLRLWFFIVVALAIGITINSPIKNVLYGSVLAFLVALPLAYWKIFKRNIIVHNITEVMIYPGIAAIFVPLLNVMTVVILLIVISLYDMYAVWHAGFMQKMAKYQIQTLKLFSGFFIPYMGPKEKAKLEKSKGKKKVKVNLAILGGGDVVFPIILAGVVLMTFGFIPALIIALGATLALAGLFYMSEKGKFYPAMPFISTGCFIALGIVYLFF